MNIIDLGFGYRLYPKDVRNWELQQWRKPMRDADSRGNELEQVPSWHGMGRFYGYSSVGQAALFVADLVMKDLGAEDERIVSLMDAVSEYERICREIDQATDASVGSPDGHRSPKKGKRK